MPSKLDLKEFGKRIVKRRNRLNISQAELAKLAGISRQYLSMIETGDRSCSLEVLVNIADALNERTDKLLYDEWPMESTNIARALQLDKDLSQVEKDALSDIVKSIKQLKTDLKTKTSGKRGFLSK